METFKYIIKMLLSLVLCGFSAFCILGYLLVNKSDSGASSLLVLGVLSGVPGIILLIRAKRHRQAKDNQALPLVGVPKVSTPANAHELFEASFEHHDPDENIPTPKGANISFLDAEALNFWDGRPSNYEIPPYYQNFAFGRNVRPALSRALAAGYLKRGDIPKSISLCLVPELKAILSEKELKTSGRKAELVQRLIENVDPYELEEMFPVTVYEITDAGRAAQEPYSLVFESRKHGLGLPVYQLIQAKEQNPGLPDQQIISKLLNKEIQSALRSKDKEAYGRAIMNSAGYLRSFGELHLALQYYCISYFLWSLNAKELYTSNGQVNQQEASILADISLTMGFSLDELLNFFTSTVENANPFGLATKANLLNALNYLRRGLGDNRNS